MISVSRGWQCERGIDERVADGAVMQDVWWEKRANIWWVGCKCETWFLANDKIIRSTAMKMRFPQCKEEFFAGGAAG